MPRMNAESIGPETFECDTCQRRIEEPDALGCVKCDAVYCRHCAADQGDASELCLCDACLERATEAAEEREAELAYERLKDRIEDDFYEDNRR